MAKSTIGPTWSLFTPLTMVTTSTTSMPARVQVLDRAQLHVEEVADLAVRVGLVADAVELQVGDAQAGLLAPAARTRGSCAKRMPLVAHCTAK